jgi:hypothetical protein
MILIPMVTWSKEHMVLDFSNIGIMSLNPTRRMDVSSHSSVLCCPVYIDALQWDDPPSKESYYMSKTIHSFKVNSEWKQARRPNL